MSGSERGEWRGIYTVLQKTPEFTDLPPEAQLIWFHLKLLLGAAGIDAVPALEYALVDLTGYHLDTIRDGIRILSEGGWLLRERNVVWLRNALRYEPSRNLENENHRKSIRAHAASLPKLAIVNDFSEYYGFEKPFSERIPSEGYRDTIAITEDGIRRTETPSSNGDSGSTKSNEPISRLWDVWIEELGGDPPHPRWTDKRRQKIRAFYREHLADEAESDAVDAFRRVLRTVKQSDHHMSQRSYQMPESLFRSPERRDRWWTLSKGNEGPSGPSWESDL